MTAARQDLERAAQYAHDVGDRAQEAHSLQYVLVAIVFGPTSVVEALERVEELRPRAEGNRRLEVTLLRVSAHLEAMQGHFDSARELIGQARALARELGLEVVLAGGIAWTAGYAELLAGDARRRNASSARRGRRWSVWGIGGTSRSSRRRSRMPSSCGDETRSLWS